MKNNPVNPFRWVSIVLLILLLAGIFWLDTAQTQNAMAAQDATAQGTFYVAPGGSDTADGSINHPWKTIQKAANTLQPGQTVLIRGGTYKERVQPAKSGSSGQEISYASYPGETPVIDGTGTSLPATLSGLLQIDGRAYIRVSGITVANAGSGSESTAILVQNSNHITLDAVHTNGSSSSGILVWDSNHITITNSIVEKSNQTGIHECLSIGLTDVFDVSHNQVFNCKKEGIDLKDGSTNGTVRHNIVHDVTQTGIYIDAWNKPTHDITLDGNLVHDSANHGIEISSEQGGALSNIYVYNNIVYHNQYVGLMISNQSTAALTNLQIINNTLANNGWKDWGGGIWVDNPYVKQLVIRNNILSQSIYFQIRVSLTVPATNVILDHNLVDGYRGHTSEGETCGTVYVTGSPAFLSVSAGNYHIGAKSPAIKAGLPTGAPSDDYDGSSRPSNGIDLGADQITSVSSKKTYFPATLAP